MGECLKTDANDAPRIAKAYRFANGMVIVFDQHGQQMPDYQGRYDEVAEKIRRDAPDVLIALGELVR